MAWIRNGWQIFKFQCLESIKKKKIKKIAQQINGMSKSQLDRIHNGQLIWNIDSFKVIVVYITSNSFHLAQYYTIRLLL